MRTVWSSLAYVAGLWVPLAFVTLWAKWTKLSQLGTGAARDVLAVVGQDLLVLAGLGALWAVALWRTRGAARAAVRVSFHALMPVATAIMVAEHSFFVISGILPDWFILKDGLIRFSSLINLYLSELTLGRAVGLSLPLLLSVALWPAAEYVRRRRKVALAPGVSGRRAALAGGAGVLALGALGAALSPSPPVRALQRNVLAGVVYDIGRDLAGAGRDARNSAAARRQLGKLGPRRLIEKDTSPAARNLVVIALESTGALYTSLYGGPYQTTPFLERLRARGALVERAYTVVPHTSKALVAMHCGIYPKFSPVVVEASTRGIPTPCLARLLRAQGFATGFVQPAEESYERRADLVKELGFADFMGKESLPAEQFDESNYFGWEDDAMVQPALRWIDAHREERFFLGMLTLTAHHPYAIPRGYPTKRYVAERELNDYLNTVAYADRFLEKLFRGFEERGLFEDTLFIVMGDHGEGFGQHGRRQHDSVIYEEGVHIPMLIVGPGVAPGSRVEGLHQLIDVPATAAGALGFAGDQPFSGRDMLAGQGGHRELFVHCHYRDYCSAFVQPGRKAIHHYGRKPDELFDLADDPGETRNLLPGASRAERALFKADVARMKRLRGVTNALYEWQARARVPAFVTRSRPADVGRPLDVTFGGAVKLLGVKIEPEEIEAGGRAVVTQYYEVLRKPPRGVGTFLHLRGPQYRNADHVPVEGAYPVQAWKPGDFIEDRHVVSTRPDTPPGVYTLYTGLWDRTAKRRLPIEGSVPTRDHGADIGRLRVVQAKVDTTEYISERPPEGSTLDVRFGDALRLVRAELDKPVSKGGLKMTVELVWQALRPLPPDLQVHVEITGRKHLRWTHQPVLSSLALEDFPPNRYVRDPLVLITRTRDPLGSYDVWLSVTRGEGGDALPVQGQGSQALSIDGNRVRVARYRLTR